MTSKTKPSDAIAAIGTEFGNAKEPMEAELSVLPKIMAKDRLRRQPRELRARGGDRWPPPPAVRCHYRKS